MFQRVQVFEAYARAIRAARHAALPFWVAGLVMGVVDCNGGSGFPGGSDVDDGSSEEYATLWSEGKVSGAPTLFGETEFGDFEFDVVERLAAEFGAGDTQPFEHAGATAALVLGVFVCVAVLALVFFLARCAIVPGYLRIHQLGVMAQPVTASKLFQPEGRFAAVVIANLFMFVLVVAFLLAIGTLVVIPVYLLEDNPSAMGVLLIIVAIIGGGVGLYLFLGLSFVEHAVVLENLSPTDALKRSWAAVRGIRLQLVGRGVLAAVAALIAFVVGLLLLCVGLVVTLPFARVINDAALTTLFLQRTGKLVAEPVQRES